MLGRFLDAVEGSEGRGWRLTSDPFWGVTAREAESTHVSGRPGLISWLQPFLPGDSGLSLISAVRLLEPASEGGLEGQKEGCL